MDIFMASMVMMVSQLYAYPQIELYTLNIHSFLHINYTSIKGLKCSFDIQFEGMMSLINLIEWLTFLLLYIKKFKAHGIEYIILN